MSPTIQRKCSSDGKVLWEVAYAGSCRQHEQEWQAWVYFEMARAAYALSKLSRQ
jgi:hypothetical protein